MADTLDLGCAVHHDGTLKDASEIEWHFDKDDDFPMVAQSPSASHGSIDAPATLSKGIHPFFAQKAAAAVVVTGSCRSGRSSCPSTCLVDLDNAMNQNPTGQKHKALPAAPSCQVVHCVIESEDEGQVPTTDGKAGDRGC